MEISKQEAREHVRAAIVWLNESSQNLKKAIRRKGERPRPQDQSNLRQVQRQLTYLHAMLAISRLRVHPVEQFVTRELKRYQYVLPEARKKELLSYTRSMIESTGESLLGRWWYQFRQNTNPLIGQDRPHLGAIWRALITIGDPEAREAAFRTGGVDAIVTIPLRSSSSYHAANPGTMANALTNLK